MRRWEGLGGRASLVGGAWRPYHEYDEQTSDDDAPEEVSLAASKQSAASLRKEQQQARLEALRHAKEQRRRQQQKNDSEADPASLSHPEDVVRIQQDTDDALEQDLDYLPEDVLQALAEQPPPTKQQQQQAVVTAQLRNSRLGKQQKRKEFAEREAGPVKVQILSRVGDAGASGAWKNLMSVFCT